MVDTLASKNLFIRANFKMYAAAALIYLVISFAVFWPLLTNITGLVVNGGGDVFQSMWNLWWVNYAVFTVHTASIYSTPLLFYPVGANLVTETLTPLLGIVSAPLQLVSLPFAYNVIFFVDFMLAGLFMFMLAYYLTKNKYAAFIAGIVFAFSPMHIAQAYGHLNWTTIEFLPLFVLFILLMVKDKKLKYTAGAAVSFILLTFMGDIEQGIIAVILTFVILVYYLFTSQRKSILSKKFALNFGEMIVIILIIGAVFFIPIASGILYNGALSASNQQTGIAYNEIWSQNILSFFLPNGFNSFFQGASQSYNYIFLPDPTETTAYIGYAVLVLALIGLYYDYKESRLSHSALWIVLLLVFGWLSLGPYIQIGGSHATGSYVSAVPGLYLLYSKIPLFNILREPGRFDLIVTLALAVLSALGITSIMKHEKLSKMNKRKTYLLIGIISIIILFEYSGIALPGNFVSSMYLNAAMPKAYTELGRVPGNFTVMLLPDTINTTRPAFYPGMEEYFQTAFKRPIVGGYTSRITNNESLSVDIIPLSQSAAYLEQKYGLIYPNPIIENVSKLNLLFLGAYNVGFVGIIRSAYNYTELTQLYGYTYSLFGNPVYESNSTIIFATNNALVNGAGKSTVAYVAGTWIPGYAICGQSYTCNSTINNLWWGSSPREIVVFTPMNSTNLRMNFTAASPQGNEALEIFVNSQNGLQKMIAINQSIARYYANLTLSPGYNQIFLYAPSQQANSNSSIYAFGINNITFSRN
jgi:hypothetical protein